MTVTLMTAPRKNPVINDQMAMIHYHPVFTTHGKNEIKWQENYCILG